MSNIQKCFEETVARFPDKRAVAYKDVSYTFYEVKLLAERLGRVIAAANTADAPVAVLVNRGADTVVMFLAVLYSGSYYVPIDPEMPPAKLQMILSDCRAGVLLAGEENGELLEKIDFSGSILYMEDARKGTEAEGTDWPEPSEDMPIYMIYTSGSTGKPKGVLKSHGAVYSFIQAYTETFELGSGEVIGNQTPFFFDASAKDIYLSLFTGATLEVLPSELFIFPATLVEYMNRRRVTYICWVPTAVALVTQMNTFKKVLPETLRRVFFVGEVFPVKQLRKWMETLPQLQYVNLYGSTELAGICCYYELDPGREVPEILPVGKPLKNCRVFLLGEQGIIKEQGAVGELCVDSPALAMEYYHDPEKTAAVFGEMRRPDGSTVKVLKTGDLAHLDEEGNLVFVSRKDYQIKHMGRRIELGEIEAAADKLSETQRVCCLYDEKKKKIVLFCELVENSTLNGKDVLHLLRSRLSAYMLPGKVIVLDRLPLNANGKIDRVSLKERM